RVPDRMGFLDSCVEPGRATASRRDVDLYSEPECEDEQPGPRHGLFEHIGGHKSDARAGRKFHGKKRTNSEPWFFQFRGAEAIERGVARYLIPASQAEFQISHSRRRGVDLFGESEPWDTGDDPQRQSEIEPTRRRGTHGAQRIPRTPGELSPAERVR